MKVALIQLAYGDDETLRDRTQRVADLVREQHGHDLVVLPELWAMGGFDYRNWAGRAQSVRGSVAQAMSAAAADIGATLHAGSIVERGRDGVRGPEGRDMWNTSVVFGPDGDLLAAYRKIHRFGFGAGEPRLMEAGKDVVTLDLPSADGSGPGPRLGLSTCYDLRFPELYRAQVDDGVSVFVVPAAWPKARVGHWTLLGRARAVEDQAFVLACNTAGIHAGVEMGGRSQVVSPTGEVVAEAGEDEEVVSVEIAPEDVTTARESFPVLADRRL
jgi:predicted amidohydrolase